MYNYSQNEQNGYNYNLQNGFGNSNFVNYPDSDVNTLLGLDSVTDTGNDVTPEQLNLLRLAAQEIGGAQFSSPKYDDKYYNFFEPSQRNSLPESNMFSVNNFNRPNSLNLDMNFNSNYDYNSQRFPNKFENFKEQTPDTELLAYLSQLNMSLDRGQNEGGIQNNMEYKIPMDNGHYQQNEDFNKMQENKMFFNRNFQPPPKTFNGEFYDMMSQMNERNPMGQNYDFANQTPGNMNYKPNGFHQNDFMRRDMNQMPREFAANGLDARANFDGALGRDNAQQALMRQNQELARQMSLLMRNRPPPNQLNVDVSFLPENAPFNLGEFVILSFLK